MIKNRKILVIVLFLVVILGEALLLSKGGEGHKSLQAYASEILEKCMGKSALDLPLCYEKEIPRLMDYMSMKEAFEVTRLVQETDTSYRFCHVLGHKLSAREVQKDPSKWKEVVTQCPSGVCSNGCIHGGFQEKFRAESLTDSQIQAIKPDLTNLCEKRGDWNPTGLEQASCYHALGHLNMYLTRADIDKSLKLCKEFTTKSDGRDYKQVCFDGVFMQIYQPLEPEDFALIKGKEVKAEQVDAFCARYSGKPKWSCKTESWPLFRESLLEPEGLVNFCNKSESADEERRCYLGIIYILAVQFDLNIEKMQTYCERLPEGSTSTVNGVETIHKRGVCFANTASRLIETDYKNIDKAIQLCTYAMPFDTEGYCFRELIIYSTFNFHEGSPEHQKVCNNLPGEWRDKCFKKDYSLSAQN